MKGHLGAVITSGVAALAVALALLQAAVISQRGLGEQVTAAATAPPGPSNRFSAPGGRSGIPWTPADAPPPRATPNNSKPQEQRAPARRGFTPEQGPRPARKAAA